MNELVQDLSGWVLADVLAPDETMFVGDGLSRVLDQARSQQADLWRCAHCNQKLSWRALITRGDEVRIVGVRCGSKAGVAQMPKALKDAKALVAARLWADPEFKRWAAVKRHPRGFSGGMEAHIRYHLSRKPEEVLAVHAQFQADGPLPAYDADAPAALALNKKRLQVRLGWTTATTSRGKHWAARIVGASEQYGFEREFCAREWGDGPRFLTDQPGVYQIVCGAFTRFVRIAADGSAVEIDESQVLGEVQA